MAVAKQATTIDTQATLAVLELAVQMCTRPWIVELSKNLQKVEEAMTKVLLGVVGLLVGQSVNQVQVKTGKSGEIQESGKTIESGEQNGTIFHLSRSYNCKYVELVRWTTDVALVGFSKVNWNII